VYTVFSPYLLSYTLSPHPSQCPLYQPSRQELFCLIVPWFCKEKKVTFLFKIAIQGDSLWRFHVYMCYYLNWLIPSILLLPSLVPFLWWFKGLDSFNKSLHIITRKIVELSIK
jgi:hypothetical protein